MTRAMERPGSGGAAGELQSAGGMSSPALRRPQLEALVVARCLYDVHVRLDVWRHLGRLHLSPPAASLIIAIVGDPARSRWDLLRRAQSPEQRRLAQAALALTIADVVPWSHETLAALVLDLPPYRERPPRTPAWQRHLDAHLAAGASGSAA